MKNRLSCTSLVLLAVVANAFVGILSNILSDDIKKILMPAGIDEYSRIQITVGLLVISVLVTTVVLYIAETNKSKDEIPEDNVPELEKARREFLADLARRYQERNDHKLDGRSEIPLLVSDESKGTHAPQFEAIPYIIRRFEPEGRLLLVGEAGSGKTVLLLRLALYLAEKAQKDASQPLPVVFNLASWSRDYAHFNDWAVAVLTKAYGLSSNIARQLIIDKRIVFLLDGLDELARPTKSELDGLDESARAEKFECAATVRAECLASLNVALHHGSINVVICCRPDELKLMLQRPDLRPPWAVGLRVHSLTQEQIDRALIRAGVNATDRFAAPKLNAALGTDSVGVYQKVLSNPFYFTTALQVFDPTIPPLVDATNEEKLKASLVVAFIEKKLQLPENNVRRFPHARTLDWLAWLADFMKERVTFELSDLQPSDLKRRWRYRLLYSLSCGVSGSLLIGFASTEAWIGVLNGAIFGLSGVYLITDDLAQWMLAPMRDWRTWLSLLLLGLIGVGVTPFLIQIIWAFDHGVTREMIWTDVNFIGSLAIIAPVMGLTTIVIGIPAFMFIRLMIGVFGGVPVSNIDTEDFTRWSLSNLRYWRTWRDALRSCLEGGVAGFTMMYAITGFGVLIAVIYYVAIYGVPKGEVSEHVLAALLVSLAPTLLALIGAPVGAFVGAILGFLRACRKIMRFANINSPYRRLRAGISFNILQWAIIGLIFYNSIFTPFHVYDWYIAQKSQVSFIRFLGSLFNSPLIYIFGTIGLFKAPLLKHSALRVCLALEGVMPLRYVEFLNYATELRILEKEGGQWRFRHQILQDYFARRAQNSDSGLAQT
jgi:NACHT domain-containing protein